MFLKQGYSSPAKLQGISLRKATNADAKEIAVQNAIYFGNSSPDESEAAILPEEEEKRGMSCFLAEKNQQIIGKVSVQIASQHGAIFGLGVLPEHRSQGYGRAILLMAIEKLREAGADKIMLQVAAENANALNLYKSCGFESTSTMDYYSLMPSS
jgi:ribosomal protein S18 acetylase RimI-like enzyme